MRAALNREASGLLSGLALVAFLLMLFVVL
jgi:hypothetical protein